jgi:hypothetical protein
MRTPLIAVLVLGLAPGCTLDLLGGDDGDDDDGNEPAADARPVPRCDVGPRYRMETSVDCGPIPPDAPPVTCFWTITREPDSVVYCWSDTCESLSYTCTGGLVVAQGAGNRTYEGELQSDGTLLWRGNWPEGPYLPF